MRVPLWVWVAAGVAGILWWQRQQAALALSTIGDLVTDYTSGWQSVEQGPVWVPVLNQTEVALGIPANLLARIAYQESSFRPDVIAGTNTSTAGALGLMQLMPQYFDTVQRPVPFSSQDTLDQIAQAGQLLVSDYRQLGNWTAAVAAYNAGAGAIGKVLAGTATLPAETAKYIQQVSADLPNVVNPTLLA